MPSITEYAVNPVGPVVSGFQLGMTLEEFTIQKDNLFTACILLAPGGGFKQHNYWECSSSDATNPKPWEALFETFDGQLVEMIFMPRGWKRLLGYDGDQNDLQALADYLAKEAELTIISPSGLINRETVFLSSPEGWEMTAGQDRFDHIERDRLGLRFSRIPLK